jgi:hypothetical protein
MPIDERLANRIRDYLAPKPGFSERRMFGGLCFMLRGHMTAGVVGPALARWLDRAITFVSSQPPKAVKAAGRRKTPLQIKKTRR